MPTPPAPVPLYGAVGPESRDSFSSESLLLCVYFNIHDRSIELSNGWEIVLGIGVGIFLKTNGRCGITACYQDKQLCKSCEITFLF
ncbi:MIT C-terminal domain-containing protein [uncultured Pontibacter sp.]|uniref:MIT C-terminal domain-containing protein n=1 Tax=uncultured Pontibacter sp. TaxID=453356 RepID=UPI00344B2D77